MTQNQLNSQPDGQSDSSTDLELFASIVTLISLLLAVIYSNDAYDIWDGLIAVTFIVVSNRYFKSDKILLVEWILKSISGAIILLTIMTCIWPLLSKYSGVDQSHLSCLLNWHYNIFPLDFILSVVMGMLFLCISKKYRTYFIYSRFQNKVKEKQV